MQLSHIRKYKLLRGAYYISLFFLASGFSYIAFANPPGSTYAPGATLDPGCTPGSVNCTVSILPSGSDGYVQFGASGALAGSQNLFWDNINYRLGIGTSSPYAKLSVVGQTLADSFNATSSVGYQQGGTTFLTTTSAAGGTGTFIGIGAGSSTADGKYNTFIGHQSGQANTNSYYNTALGYQSLYSNFSFSLLNGQSNTAIGARSLYSNITGNSNTALGKDSLYFNTGGFNNTGIGSLSLYSNTTGDNNTTVGAFSLYSNTTGFFNTTFGNSSLFSNTTGSYNSFLGYQAGYYNTSATSTTALGVYAAAGTADYSNQGGTYLGYSAGFSAATGSDYNTLLGYNSGYGVTTGARNVLIGQSTIVASYNQVTTGSNNIALGNDVAVASPTASNQLSIGNLIYGTNLNGTGATISTGNIGIGNKSPASRLDITNSATSSPVVSLRDPLGNVSLELRAGTSTLYNTFMGLSAGQANTTGSYNSFLGYQAGYSNTTDSYNSFLGYQSGYSNTTGSFNSFLGYRSGYSNTTGYRNTFLGINTGYSNTTGDHNSFLGPYAGYSNTTGSYNSFIGFDVGQANTTGSRNSFLGNYAGQANTTGGYNVFFGNQAGYFNTSGYENSFLGPFAGFNNTIGSKNSFIGSATGYANTTGSYNTALGYQAGYNITTGYDNIFIGQDRNTGGTAITTGGGNIGLGYNIKFPAVSTNNMLNIGNFLFANLPATTTATTIGNTPLTGLFGVGTSSPYAKLTVWGGDTLATSRALEVVNSASTTLFTIMNNGLVGIATTTPSSRLAITQSANTSAGGLYLAETGNTDFRSMFMDTAGVMSFYGGDTAGTLNTATLSAAGAWTNASDASYKENILPINNGLKTLLQLQPRHYTMKGSGQAQIGFIAQEVKGIVPEVVEGVDGSMGISYGNLGTLTVSAVQDLSHVFDGTNASTTTPTITSFYTGTTTPALFVDATGKIGIGTTTPAYKLHVLGDIAAQSFVNTSTRDAKKDITRLSVDESDAYLEDIKNLGVSKYRYVNESATSTEHLGLIAEEAPASILAEGGKGIDLYKYVSVLVGAFQSLVRKVEGVVAKVASFADVFTTRKLCVSKANGTDVCVTGDQLEALLAGQVAMVADTSIPTTETSLTTPLTLEIQGNNPATINVGDTYGDLGAVIIAPESAKNFGIKASLDGGPALDISQISIDTSIAGTHTIIYSVVDQNNATTTAERIVKVVPLASNLNLEDTDNLDAGSPSETATTTTPAS